MAYRLPDFHSHILPGADHGSDGPDTTFCQLAFAGTAGVDRIVATPHFYPQRHSVSSFLKRRNDAYALLCREAEKREIPLPQIRLGAEVLLCDGLDRMDRLSDLCMAGTDALLLELPFSDFHPELLDTVELIARRGIAVYLAHADRYPEEVINRILDAVPTVNIQLNADALCGLFLPKRLRAWLDAGFVKLIGSDIHKRDAGAYSRFLSAQKKLEKHGYDLSGASDALFFSLRSI